MHDRGQFVNRTVLLRIGIPAKFTIAVVERTHICIVWYYVLACRIEIQSSVHGQRVKWNENHAAGSLSTNEHLFTKQ